MQKSEFSIRPHLKRQIIGVITLTLISGITLAAPGGLDKATNILKDIQKWMYTITGVMALCYMIFNIIMCFMERKSWGDVGMSGVYCAIAGGAVGIGTWALDLFAG